MPELERNIIPTMQSEDDTPHLQIKTMTTTPNAADPEGIRSLPEACEQIIRSYIPIARTIQTEQEFQKTLQKIQSQTEQLIYTVDDGINYEEGDYEYNREIIHNVALLHRYRRDLTGRGIEHRNTTGLDLQMTYRGLYNRSRAIEDFFARTT